MKIGLALFAFFIAALVVLFRFSSSTDAYICSGVLSSEIAADKDITIYLAHEKYAPWVRLWSDSDGSVWIEGEEVFTTFYFDIAQSERTLFVYDKNSSEPRRLVGQYSFLRDFLTINLGWQIFQGHCSPKSDGLQSRTR